MHKKSNYRKVDLLGTGKKTTKIYKVEHIPTGKYYALKEVECRNIEKLNDYKEEAMQLSKIQGHPHMIKYYGYFFQETIYNTYRLGIIMEFLSPSMNMENVLRSRQKKKLFYPENDLLEIFKGFVCTLAFLQKRGICHRDLKPANMFLEGLTVKIIDFGESKDFLMDDANDNEATIRGTPQYLSPVLWKAHLMENINVRKVKHNIYKSDVFSSGLVLYQIATLRDVTGFNQRNHVNDGVQLVKDAVREMKSRYSNAVIDIVRAMLAFEEGDRPDFAELERTFFPESIIANLSANSSMLMEQLNMSVLSELNNSFSGDKSVMMEKIRSEIEKSFNLTRKAEETKRGLSSRRDSVADKENQGVSGPGSGKASTRRNSSKAESIVDSSKSNIQSSRRAFDDYDRSTITQNNLVTETLSKNYASVMTNDVFWFEYGGRQICKYDIDRQVWRKHCDVPEPFSPHFALVYLTDGSGIMQIGGLEGRNCVLFTLDKFQHKTPMVTERNFFPAIQIGDLIYVFGGFNIREKRQLKSCEVYDIKKDTWNDSKVAPMIQARSQSSVCVANYNSILVFGGYNKDQGTLDTIEEYNIEKNQWSLLDTQMPLQLRRFSTVKIKENEILLLGGFQNHVKESERVLLFDMEQKKFKKCKNLPKGGTLESPVFYSDDGFLHLFLENDNGTNHPLHLEYSILEY
mmetsp:Transcript_26864/g.30939  ORF Transcript_26864/g.30939 Transcript_26864/m.30939 type:complete len:687 (+) Transcript_26864:477-2537(+)